MSENNGGKIRIMLCDDSPYLCEAYHIFIDGTEDMECVCVANDADSCVASAQKMRPDLLLLDIQMETENAGCKALAAIKEIAPEIKIIMLTGYDDSQYVFNTILNGANGYVLKQMDMEKMFQEIRSVYASAQAEKQFDFVEVFKEKTREVYDNLRTRYLVMNEMVNLTPLEYQVLRQIYEGKKYKEIASKRIVEESTIKNIASNILKKLQVDSMKSLIRILKDLNFFSPLE